MRHLVRDIAKGDSTRARSLRSSIMVGIGFGGSNVLRLASNLALTRLLFPEVFGLMALVQVFMTGLQMFSDLGINLSIIQHERGEEPDFLNTAWTIQIIRGVALWLGSCILAWPAALIYGEPQLAILLPVVGLNAIILGFTTTRIALVNRNLQIGVQTFTDLGSQVAGLLITILLAWTTRSVWALVIGLLCTSMIKVVAQQTLLKGPANRLHFDRDMSREIIRFGKYIFLSSIAGFLVNQSDRAILGGYVPLTELGIYSVAYVFANVPLQLAQAAGGQIIFPIYRKFMTTESAGNRAKVAKARRLVLLSTVLLGGLLTLASVPLVNLLYDHRYTAAGPILALLGFSVTAQIATSNYDGAHLSHGNSKWHFNLICLQAIVQVVLSFLLISRFGLIGAVFALGVSSLVVYPFKAYVANRYRAWDPLADGATFALGLGFFGLSCVLWHDSISALLAGR
ncbi:oligosaccharide flippase family protein [Sphingomonas quercus]|uniref:Oligosaccharide flippase family protein n=1 Tax=Sphingomonas quercus TaxID=2842451 RepID=A0ABS6BFX6_9SPHN|nr:oligosaccharide flippase family protein [Sphingomonas quercus]MBU3077195.1 oligosaccharide flippase family protein [Sphingomonas quercus]